MMIFMGDCALQSPFYVEKTNEMMGEILRIIKWKLSEDCVIVKCRREIEMEKKVKWKKIASLALILLGISYFILTPIGSLRMALLMNGHPITACTLELEENTYGISAKENQIGYSLKNPPVEAETDAELVNWIVTRYGVFYLAKYYGWG